MARTTIPAELVAINAIQGTLIADNAVTAVHIATNAVSGTLIADNAVTSTHIAQNHVTATQIANNTITVTQLADNAVETDKINADAVTGAKIADDAIDSEHYTDGSIDTAHIGDLQVTAAKIGANAVTLAKMASLARGSILIGNSSADVTALAIGSNDYVLTSDGTDIAWEAASSFNADAAQVFNESGNDVDFRVESNDSANMLSVNGGDNNVSINANNTASVTNSATALAARTLIINGNEGEGSDNLSFFAMADGTGNYGMEVSNSAHTAQYDLLINPIMGGNVGIGKNTAPQDLLEIRQTADSNGGLTISASEHDRASLSFARSSTATARIYITEPGATHTSAMHFQTSDASGSSPNLATAMTIDSLGNLSSPATGGHVQIDNGIGVTVRETMTATGHAWQSNTYNVLSAGSTSIGTDSTGTTHMWFNSYDTGSKYSVKAGHSADLYHGITNGQFVLRMSANPTTSNGEGITMLQRLYIDKDGTFQLHSAGTNDTTIKFYKGASTVKWWMQNDTSGSPGSDSFWIGDEENDNGVYVVQDGSSWQGISDERLKRSWTNLTNATDKIDTLTKVGTFQRRGKSTGNWLDNREVGLSAQEVEAILPEAVHTGGDIEFAADDKVTGVKGMSYEKLVPLLVKSIQELNARIKTLEG